MAAPIQTRADYEHILKILDCAANRSRRVALQRFGLSAGAYAGIAFRTVKASDKVPCKCKRRANRDGGMPRYWWKD